VPIDQPSDQPPAPSEPEPSAEGPSAEDPSPPGPLWKQIRDDLARAIERGVFAPGRRIPSVARLRQDYMTADGRQCSTSVVQRALLALQMAGFLAPSRAGSPHRVADQPPAELPPTWGVG
jgi:DNA-binding transcriptional regulator YhcF (GntR family)